MARSRATISTSIHADEDWRALPPAAKLTYLTLLSQSTVSLAGCVEYNPGRWAALTGYSPDEIRTAIDTLADGERPFVVVDEDTYELVVRTFIRHDIGETPNRNTLRGMWSAWRAILSPRLRKAVLDAMPEALRATADATIDATPAPEAPANSGNERSIDRSDERSGTGKTVDGTTVPTVDQTSDATAVPTTSTSTSSSTVTATHTPSSTALAVVPDPGSPPTATERVTAAEFAAWWERYPRKVGRADAEKAYRTVRRKVPAARLTAALDAHLPAWATFETQFIPHPSTWLRQGRWQDPPPQPRQAARGGKPDATRAKLAASLARMTGQQHPGTIPARAVQ